MRTEHPSEACATPFPAAGMSWNLVCRVKEALSACEIQTQPLSQRGFAGCPFSFQLFRMRKDYTMENLMVTVEE